MKGISLARWEAEANPHLSVYRQALTLLGAVVSADLRAQILPHALL